MATILIENEVGDANGAYFSMSVGKVSGFVGVASCGYVTVLCKNASHRAHKMGGRTFRDFAEAKAAYRSSEMKAMIEYAERSPLVSTERK